MRLQALHGEDQEGEVGTRMPKRSKRAWEIGADEEETAKKEREEEEARERDQREKEEFAERLRLKDEEKTKKIMEAKVSKEQLEVRRRLLHMSYLSHPAVNRGPGGCLAPLVVSFRGQWAPIATSKAATSTLVWYCLTASRIGDVTCRKWSAASMPQRRKSRASCPVFGTFHGRPT